MQIKFIEILIEKWASTFCAFSLTQWGWGTRCWWPIDIDAEIGSAGLLPDQRQAIAETKGHFFSLG